MYKTEHKEYSDFSNNKTETIVTFDLVLGKTYKFNMLKNNFTVLTDLKLEFDISQNTNKNIFKKNFGYKIIREISVLINNKTINILYCHDIYHQTIVFDNYDKIIINFPLFYNNPYLYRYGESYDCDLIVKISDQKNLLVENLDKKIIIDNAKIILTHVNLAYDESYEKFYFHKFMTHRSETQQCILNKINYKNLYKLFVEQEQTIKEIMFSISDENNSLTCFNSIPIVESVSLMFNYQNYLCVYGDEIKSYKNIYTIKLSDNINFTKIKDVRLYCTFKKEIADKYCDSDLIIYITTLVY